MVMGNFQRVLVAEFPTAHGHVGFCGSKPPGIPVACFILRHFVGFQDGDSNVAPTCKRTFEQRIAALEGADAAVATASGMAAILSVGMALLKSGDHVVCSRDVF